MEDQLFKKDAPVIPVDCELNPKPTAWGCACGGGTVIDGISDSCLVCGQRYDWQNSKFADRRHKLEKRRETDATARKDPIIVKVEEIAGRFPHTGNLNMFAFGNEVKHMRGRLDPTGASLLALAEKLATEQHGRAGFTSQGFLAMLKGYYNKYGPAALDFKAKGEPASQDSFKEGALANDNRPSK